MHISWMKVLMGEKTRQYGNEFLQSLKAKETIEPEHLLQSESQHKITPIKSQHIGLRISE